VDGIGRSCISFVSVLSSGIGLDGAGSASRRAGHFVVVVNEQLVRGDIGLECTE
jgi:hypothetical protein